MTSPGQVAGATQQAAGQTASAAKDEASQIGQTAVGAAADVAGTAKEQVGQVAGEAVDQVRKLTGQARDQVSSQADNATAKLSDSLRSLAAEVRQLSQGQADGSGTVAGLAQQLADKGEQLATYLSQQGPGGLVQELRGFASRRPGGFLLGALAAGLTTGRVVKGASAASASAGASTSDVAASLPAYVPATPSYLAPVPGGEPYPAVPASEPYPPAGGGSYLGAGDRSGSEVGAGPIGGLHAVADDALGAAPPYPPGSGPR